MWVWGENGPDAVLESLLSKPALVAALEDKEGIQSGRVVPGALVQRDLAYSWDTFMENIMVRAVVRTTHLLLLLLHPAIPPRGEDTMGWWWWWLLLLWL